MIECFTEQKYLQLLCAANERYRFISFNDNFNDEDVALWRHDIDVSPHRALALARIENKLDVSANYFVQVTSLFYSVFDYKVKRILSDLIALGHQVGLHFDPLYYNIDNDSSLISALTFERDILSKIVGEKIEMFSLHNPTVEPKLNINSKHYSCMINASSDIFYKGFEYCSDSNGLWRHRSLSDVIDDDECKKIHILTHPVWWQEIEMSPREKIQRSVDGRATNTLSYYDALLNTHSRPNVGNV